MKTPKNNIWTHYLLIGVYSLFLSLSFNSCKKDKRSRNAQFYYVNETDHNIIVSFRTQSIFTLKPRETHLIKENQPTEKRAKNVTAEEYVNPLSINDLKVKLDNRCLISSATSINSLLNISSYRAEKITHADFKFTYTFTEEDYNRATDCP